MAAGRRWRRHALRASINAVAQQHAAAQPITERDRAAHQQQRIGNGVKSGQLTPHETQLTWRIARRTSISRRMRTAQANGGKLTPQEHQQINQRQNNVSRSINNDKHNGATDKPVQHQDKAEGHDHAR